VRYRITAGRHLEASTRVSGRRCWPRLITFCLTAVVVAGCATTLAPSPTGDELGSLAGAWRGRVLGPLGHATASMTIKEDGTYTGTMFLDTGDREFNGVIIAVGAGRTRYQGTDGNGRVILRQQDGRRLLRFVPDGGGAGGTFMSEP
jgi:hypothetical protein